MRINWQVYYYVCFKLGSVFISVRSPVLKLYENQSDSQENEEFEAFHTELRELLQAMNYRKDKKKFLSLEKDERYAHLSKET